MINKNISVYKMIYFYFVYDKSKLDSNHTVSVKSKKNVTSIFQSNIIVNTIV